MIKFSITFRLLAFITVAFFITTLSVLFLATHQLNDIIYTSQNAVYSEKLDAILGTLDRTANRLRLTENVEAYEEDFKKSALQTLEQIYYRSASQTIYPLILDLDGKIILQPKSPKEGLLFLYREYIDKILTLKNGNFFYSHGDGSEKWIIFRYFREWDWIICYTVPLDVIYADARRFRTGLVFIMGVITLLVLFALALIIARFTKPIVNLTKISAEMAKGNLEIPIDTKGKDEVGVLSRSFVHMRDSIREKILELEQEIRRRKSAQAEQARLIKIMESTSDLVATVKADFTFMYMNHSGRKMVGWSQDEDMGSKKISDVHPPWAYQKVIHEGIPEAFEHGLWEGETALLGPDGKEIPVSQVIMSHKSPLGEIEYLSTIIRDITDRKRSEMALKESEEKYRTVLESIKDGYFEVDIAGDFTFFNDSMSEILKRPKDELMGMNYRECMDGDDAKKTYPVFKEVDITEVPAKTLEEWELDRKDGSQCFVETVVSPITDSDGRLIGYRGIARDVTDRKLAEREKSRLEAKLQQAQKMEAMGALAGGVAHDFNNILMGIQGRISLMLTDSDASRCHFEHLREIENYVKSATALTKQLLGFARGGKYEIKPTDLNELLVKENRMFGRTRKEIDIQEEFEPNLWTVEIDRGQIEQVLLNIYVNAWQAMHGGGNLSIRTENIKVDDNCDKPYLAAPGNYVKVSITDTGVGMDEETRQRIFDPFFTTKEMGRGTGLGLASAYGIIKNHKGFIDVYSKKGEGTTFSIYLPASEKTAGKEQEVDEELIRGTETVLLVDDENIILEVGKELFENLGYRVLTAKNGKEAIDIYIKEQGRIDLVVLDMIMPGMGGRETYDGLKEINPDVKVLLSSGYSIDGQATEILNRGCNGFIQKPFNIAVLSQKTREVLDITN